MIQITDDGTLDTVLRCSLCGTEERFNYQNSGDDPDDEETYDEFVDRVIEDMEEEHWCEDDEETI